ASFGLASAKAAKKTLFYFVSFATFAFDRDVSLGGRQLYAHAHVVRRVGRPRSDGEPCRRRQPIDGPSWPVATGCQAGGGAERERRAGHLRGVRGRGQLAETAVCPARPREVDVGSRAERVRREPEPRLRPAAGRAAESRATETDQAAAARAEHRIPDRTAAVARRHVDEPAGRARARWESGRRFGCWQ